MIDIQTWMPEILIRLQKSFGDHLIYLGLQGSYRRGEAHESSDIDIVVLLDAVSIYDLDMYKSIVRTMPEGDKACGFFCGIKEFSAWPRHEIFPFKMDTDDYYGKLEDYTPLVTNIDIQRGVNIGASALMHTLTHSYLYAKAESRTEILKAAYKSAFFLMQVHHYITSGIYCRSKQDLLANLSGSAKNIILVGPDSSFWLTTNSEKDAFIMLLDWCSDLIVATSKEPK